MKHYNSVSGGLDQKGGRQLQRKPERKIKEPWNNSNTLETHMEKTILYSCFENKIL